MVRFYRALVLFTFLLAGCMPALLTTGGGRGRPAPAIDGTDASGEPLRLEDQRGKVVLLHFGHAHCPPCRAMLAHERTFLQKYAGRPFVVLGVSADESLEALREFQKKQGSSYPTWWDGPEGPIASTWGIDRYPTLFLLDHQGNVRYHHVGLPSPNQVEAQIETLLQEAEKR